MELNKIYNCDALEGIKKIPDNSVDLVVTDPPYYIENLKKDLKEQTIRGSSKNNIFCETWDSGWKNKDEFMTWIDDVLIEIKRVLRPKGQCYMFMSYHHIPELINLIKLNDYRYYKPLIWYKPDTMGVFPNQYGCNYEMIIWFRKKAITKDDKKYSVVNNIGCGQRDVFTHYSTNIKYREECGFHPTPKPVALIRQFIKNATNEGDVVLDCFMGSGTTAVAAKSLNRKYIGFEANPDYIKIINKRLKQENLKEWFK